MQEQTGSGLATQGQTGSDLPARPQPQPARDRTTLWALIIGGIGVVVAIVALVIAISAMNATNDDQQIAKAVRQEANEQISGVRAELQKNVSAATVVLTKLQAGSAQADRARTELSREANANRSGVASNQAAIKAVQANLAALTTKIDGLATSVTTLTTNQATLTGNQATFTKEVTALQKEVAALQKIIQAQ
jgi:chromosome segregation ATPase